MQCKLNSFNKGMSMLSDVFVQSNGNLGLVNETDQREECIPEWTNHNEVLRPHNYESGPLFHFSVYLLAPVKNNSFDTYYLDMDIAEEGMTSNSELVAAMKSSNCFSDSRVELAFSKIKRGDFFPHGENDLIYHDQPIKRDLFHQVIKYHCN